MRLHDCVDNMKTDKGTAHSYINLYESLLSTRRESAKHVLEIGIGDFLPDGQNGGSIQMWHKYFPNAIVYAMDIKPLSTVMNELKYNDKIKLFTSVDAYDKSLVDMFFKDIKFDVLLDDGPHTLESMKMFIRLYVDKMSDTGILMIEDVQDPQWFEELKQEVPEHLKSNIKTFDLRHIIGRYDDLVFVIDKMSN